MTSVPRTTRRSVVSRALARRVVARHTTGRLYVGTDGEKIIVGPNRVRMRTGRGIRRQWGSITELTPAVPSGRGRAERIATASQLALGSLVLSALLTGAGIPFMVCFVGALAVVAGVARMQSRAASPGVLALPRGDASVVLYADGERVAFARGLAVAKRLQRTWPALHHMIDVGEADGMLSRALSDLAAVLGRRQEIRRLRTELARVDQRDLPADSPAVAALVAQRSRVEQLWCEAGAEANRHLAAIDAAATAGERLIREQHVGRTAQAAEQAIARLTAAGAAVPAQRGAGRELADRTAAVIEAYRDLAARYGTGV